uniref:Putative nickel insertion protein n=1 Tax=Desulfobacca acetoxidans TaxID=60893 RepID=A0A7C3WIQ6_9BACT
MSNLPPTERWAYFDCFSGLSGDMTLGAMLDLGLEAADLEGILNSLEIGRLRLEVREASKEHLRGVKVGFHLEASPKVRTYAQIRTLLETSPLPERTRNLSLAMFRLLGEVEARIHGQPLETVHFHELGATDTILDVVGVAFGVEQLGITRVFVSPIPLGWGMIAGAHGRLPNPAPAALELLKGLPIYGTDLPGELVTPTGAAILRALEAEGELCPPLRLQRVGYGAGSLDLPGHPNLLRLYLGEPLTARPGLREKVLLCETHLDDMIPELYEPLMERLFAAGALDVALAAIQMKKNRPGVRVTVISPLAARESILETLFRHSTTLGVRLLEVERVAARRWEDTVATPYGPLRVKVMEYAGHRRFMPEYEDCRRLAEKHGLPLLEIYRLIPNC